MAFPALVRSVPRPSTLSASPGPDMVVLQEFESVSGIQLPDGHYVTVAGFVIACLGRMLPETGGRVKISGHLLTVLVMDRMRIGRIRVTPANDPRIETS